MTEEQKPRRCDETGMCSSMLERLAEGHIGLEAVHLTNLATGTERFFGVRYRTGAKDKNGLLLNVCPWCLGLPGTFDRQGMSADLEAMLRRMP